MRKECLSCEFDRTGRSDVAPRSLDEVRTGKKLGGSAGKQKKEIDWRR